MLNLLLSFQLLISTMSGYHHKGKRDIPNTRIVIHADESPSEKVALNYLRKTRKAYHYYITRSGKVIQMVNPDLVANHAGWSLYHGLRNWNAFSIGVAFANDGHQAFTAAQYTAGKALVDTLKRRYPMLSDERIVTHHDIAKFRGKNDPNSLFVMDSIGVHHGTK